VGIAVCGLPIIYFAPRRLLLWGNFRLAFQGRRYRFTGSKIEDLVMKPDALSDAEVIWPEAWAMASAAARRSGMPIEQWLNYAIIDTAADEGVRLSRGMSQSDYDAPPPPESYEPTRSPQCAPAHDEAPIQPEHSDPLAQDHPMQKLVEAIVQLNGHLEKLVDGEPPKPHEPDRRHDVLNLLSHAMRA
jgi:hypothetical protein